MFNHPDVLLSVAREQQRQMVAEAQRYRLLNAARAWRRARAAAATASVTPAVRGRPEGTLARWGSRAGAPAR